MAFSLPPVEGKVVLKDEFTSVLRQASSQLAKAGDAAKRSGESIARIGSNLTALSAPIAAAGIGAFKFSSDFSASLLKIENLVGINRDTLDGWKDELLDLGGDVAQAPKAVADALFFVTSAGLRGENALEALKAAGQAAAIGLGQMEVIADATTSAMNAYGQENLSATRATNILALAVRAGKLESEQLAPVLGRLLPTASAMGIAFEDVAGVLAVMSRTGLDAAESSTSLSAIMSTLLKPTTQAKDALASVGLSLASLREVAKGPGGIVEVMRALEERFLGNDEALAQVVPNVRAFRGVMNVLAQDASVVDEVMATVASKTDVLGEGMARLAADPGFKFEQFLAKAKITLTKLGEALTPVFDKLLTAGNKLLEWVDSAISQFSQLPVPVQATVLGFAALAAAAGPVLFVVGKLMVAWGSILQVLPQLASAFALVVKFMTGPIGLAVAATSLLLAFKPVREFLLDLSTSTLTVLRDAISSIITTVKSWWDATERIRALIVEFAAVAIADLISMAKGLAERLMLAAGTVIELRKAVISSVSAFLSWSGVLDIAKAGIDLVTRTVGALWDWMKRSVAALVEWVGGLDGVIKALSVVSPGLAAAITKMREWAATAADNVSSNALLTTAVEATTGKVIELEAAVKKSTTATGDFVESAKPAATALLNLSGAAETVVDLTDRVAQSSSDAGQAFDLSKERAALLAETYNKVSAGSDNLVSLTRRLSEAHAKGIISTEDLSSALERLEQSVANNASSMSDSFEIVTESFIDLVAGVLSGSTSIVDGLKSILINKANDVFSGFINNLKSGLSDGLASGKGFISSLLSSWGSAKQSFGGIANSIATAFGAASGNIQSMFMGALSSIQGFATGNFAQGIIGAAGVAIGAIKKIFGSGPTIEERLSKFFKQFKEGKATVKDFVGVADKLAETLRKVASGSFDASRATEILENNFDALVDAARELGGESLEALKKVVEAAQQSGVGLEVIAQKLRDTWAEAFEVMEERAEFLLERSQALIDGVLSMLSATAVSTAAEIQFATDSVIQAFNAMIEAGLPLSQALDRISEAMDIIRERGESAGQSLGPEFQRFGEMLDILSTEKMKRVIERLEGMATAAQAAGDMGILSAGQFDTFAQRVGDSFAALKAGGLTAEEAIAALAPQLQILNDLAQQYGYELDNNKQGLLGMAIAQGVVTDKGLTQEDILIRGFDRILEALNAVIEALGGVPVALEQWGVSSTAATESVLADFGSISSQAIEQADITAAAWEQSSDKVTYSWSAASDAVTASWSGATDKIASNTQQINNQFNDYTKDLVNGFATISDEGINAFNQVFMAADSSAAMAQQAFHSASDKIRKDFKALMQQVESGLGSGTFQFNFDPPAQFHSGSDGFQDFGAGTPAMLHGAEQVVTFDQGKGIAEMVGTAISKALNSQDQGKVVSVLAHLLNINQQQLAAQKDLTAKLTTASNRSRVI